MIKEIQETLDILFQLPKVNFLNKYFFKCIFFKYIIL